jgi:hypothetical protein
MIDEAKFGAALRKASSQLQQAVDESQKLYNAAAAPSFLLRGMAQAAITVMEGLAPPDV